MAIDFDNPFTPVVGKVPLHIAGRDMIIADVETALSGAGNDPAIISLLVGPRGMGKTALLSYFADAAESSGWITARVTCVEGMLEDILIRTQRAARHLVNTNPSRKIKVQGLPTSFRLSWRTRLASYRTGVQGWTIFWTL